MLSYPFIILKLKCLKQVIHRFNYQLHRSVSWNRFEVDSVQTNLYRPMWIAFHLSS
jgi:hypothetical protein